MIYRFKVKFEEDDDFIAVIETSVKQSFYHMHDIIQEAIGFNKKQEASMYTSNDNWKPLKEFEIPTNYAELIADGSALPSISKFIIDPYQKFLYLADKENEWILEIELMKIDQSVDGQSYPRIVRTEGFPPKQFIAQPIPDDEMEDAPEFEIPSMPSLEDPIPKAPSSEKKKDNESAEDFNLDDFPDLDEIDELDLSDEMDE